MSPEQIDARTIDARSDLYSLGLIFYEMLCGDPPFNSPSPRELLNLQCTAMPPALDDEVRKGLPRGVEDTLFAMLEKKPDDRPSSAREVVEKLSLFRAAAGDAPGRPSRARPSRDTRDSREPAPETPRMANAPVRPESSAPSREGAGDTMQSGASKAPAPAAKADRPRTDTVALVEQNASRAREVPTWLAIVAIVALSLVAGMTTYIVRLKTAGGSDASSTTTASASYWRSGAKPPSTAP
jgi:serine/threonine-protein kinase